MNGASTAGFAGFSRRTDQHEPRGIDARPHQELRRPGLGDPLGTQPRHPLVERLLHRPAKRQRPVERGRELDRRPVGDGLVHADDAVHDLGQRLGLWPGVAGVEHHQPEIPLVAGTQHVHEGRSAHRLGSALARSASLDLIAAGPSSCPDRTADLGFVPSRSETSSSSSSASRRISSGLPWLLKWTTWGWLSLSLRSRSTWSGSGDQNQLHRIAKRAEADLLVDLPELTGQVEWGCPARVGGEEQDLDHLGPYRKRCEREALSS